MIAALYPGFQPKEGADIAAGWGGSGQHCRRKWRGGSVLRLQSPCVRPMVPSTFFASAVFTNVQQRPETFGACCRPCGGSILQLATANVLRVLPNQQLAATHGAQIMSVWRRVLAAPFLAVGLRMVSAQETRGTVSYAAMFWTTQSSLRQRRHQDMVGWHDGLGAQPYRRERFLWRLLTIRRLLARVHTRFGTAFVFVGHAFDLTGYALDQVTQWQ